MLDKKPIAVTMGKELLMYDETEYMVRQHGVSEAQGATGLKKCPYCAESIQPEAIKCRYCGEFLDGSRPAGLRNRPKKWYFATGTVVLALLCLGPLALPLVWLNPRYHPTLKAIITIIVLGVTILFLYLVVMAYQRILGQFSELAF